MEPDQLIDFTRAILREKSLTGQEAGVVARLAAQMRALGFDRVWTDENGSAVGILQGDLPGPTLLLDGHCDVVDAMAADWQHDPFGAEIDGSILYGRGAADMKGALAAMIFAAASSDRKRMAGRVAVSATVMEEVLEGGSLKAVMAEVQPDYVVIGESTGFNLNHGGRGRAEVVLETSGRSAHSSSPQAGLCAVHEMLKVIARVEAMPLPAHALVGNGQMTLTDMISSPYPAHSVLPNRCRVTYDRRLVPGETPASVLDSLKDLPGLEGVDWRASILSGLERTASGQELGGLRFFPAWALDPEHPFAQAALRGLRAAGFEPGLGAYRFCTNAAYAAGEMGVPTLGFGPGQETDAHTADEHIRLEDLQRAAQGYAAIIDAVLCS